MMQRQIQEGRLEVVKEEREGAQSPAAGEDCPLADRRILIVEDFAYLASQEARLLELAGASCSIAGTFVDARAAIERGHYDVALVDLELPDGNGLDLVPDILRRSRATGVVVFSAFLDRELSAEVTRLGAVAIDKGEADAKDLVPQVVLASRRAAQLQRPRGRGPRSGPVAKCGARDPEAFAQRLGFTRREREAFEMLLDGLAPKEIAIRFGTSERMAELHVKNACRKCGAGDRCGLLAEFSRWAGGEKPASAPISTPLVARKRVG